MFGFIRTYLIALPLLFAAGCSESFGTDSKDAGLDDEAETNERETGNTETQHTETEGSEAPDAASSQNGSSTPGAMTETDESSLVPGQSSSATDDDDGDDTDEPPMTDAPSDGPDGSVSREDEFTDPMDMADDGAEPVDEPTNEETSDQESTEAATEVSLTEDGATDDATPEEGTDDTATDDATTDDTATDDAATDDTATDDAATDDGSTDDGDECPEGQDYFYPGCGLDPNPLVEGCYQECRGEDDTSCDDGKVCRVADINPCVCDDLPFGAGCCGACGAGAWLCQDPSVDSTCADTAQDPTISVASDSFGLCVGECVFELELSAGEDCDVAVLAVSDHVGDVTRVNSGVLTETGHDAVRGLAAALSGTELSDVYGCPDCADAGASSVTLVRNGKTTTHSYEYHDPPEVLQDVDDLLRALKNALRACEDNPWIEVDTACVPESPLE